jgi:hypothetical protein
MVSLKEVQDRPKSPPSHVYFSLSGEEIPLDELVDIRCEKDGSIIRGTSLLVDISFGIFCRMLLNLLDDALHMFKYIHTHEFLRSLSPMILLYYYQHKRLLRRVLQLHVQVGICVNCKQNYVGER